MSNSLIGRKYRFLGQLLLWGIVAGLCLVGWGVQRGEVSASLARIFTALLLVAFAAGYFALRRGFRQRYALLPVSSQLEIDWKTYENLRRIDTWLRIWLVCIAIAIAGSQWTARGFAPSARLALLVVGVFYFGFTLLYLRGTRRSMKRLDEKLVQAKLES